MPPKKRSFSGQLVRFIVIGVTNVLLDFACYRLLLALGVSVGLAKGLAYGAGMISGYFGNKLWTFQSRTVSAREPIAYVLVYAVGLAANVLTNAAALLILGDTYTGTAFLAATAVSTALNFIGLKYIAFREQSEPVSQGA